MISLNIFGIEFRVSVGFMCMLGLMLYIDKTGLMVYTLEATLIHEMGHLIMFCLFGCRLKKVELKVGAAIIGGDFATTKGKTILVLLGGSAMNFCFCAMYILGYYFFGGSLILNKGLVMFVIGVFNLLPIKGLDGGDIIYHTLQGCVSQFWAKKIVFIISAVLIGGLFLLGIWVFFFYGYNPAIILMAIYLFFSILLGKKQKE